MRMRVRIRSVNESDPPHLRSIAVAAKCHWGYEIDLVTQWSRQDLTDEALATKRIFVAESGKERVAWASLIPGTGVCVLDDLWVDPDWMGKGIGTVLFRHAVEQARASGATRVEWEAEPNASGFYAKVGGRYLRDSEPTAFGRVIAVMGVEL